MNTMPDRPSHATLSLDILGMLAPCRRGRHRNTCGRHRVFRKRLSGRLQSKTRTSRAIAGTGGDFPQENAESICGGDAAPHRPPAAMNIRVDDRPPAMNRNVAAL